VKRVSLIVMLAAMAVIPPVAVAGPHVASDAEVDGTQVHQEINYRDSQTIHYWIHASNPAGVRPFCVTLRLEKKGKNGWQGIGMGSRKGVRECCPQPDEECFPTETDGNWDLFVYPRGKTARRVANGRLRIHGFSDFGPSIVLRLDRPRP
jgi:hypothetical protein